MTKIRHNCIQYSQGPDAGVLHKTGHHLSQRHRRVLRQNQKPSQKASQHLRPIQQGTPQNKALLTRPLPLLARERQPSQNRKTLL